MSFTLFANLPGEIKIKIWEFALPGPRNVVLNSPWRKERKWQAKGLWPMLHACSESRAQIEKHFLYYRQEHTNTFILADLSKDIISSTLIEHNYGYRLVSLLKKSETILTVKKIAVDAEYYCRSRPPPTLPLSMKTWAMKLLYQVCNYNALEEIIFVHTAWNQEFVDLMKQSYFKDAYHTENHWGPHFARLPDANMTISTLPDVRHITQADFDAIYL